MEIIKTHIYPVLTRTYPVLNPYFHIPRKKTYFLKTHIYPVLNPYLPRTNPYLKYGFFAQVPASNLSGFFNSDEVICNIQDPENVHISLVRAALICYDCICCFSKPCDIQHWNKTFCVYSILAYRLVSRFHCGIAVV